MPQRDYIVQGIKVKQKTIFDMAELYKMMYRWFELYGYIHQEVEYRDSDEPNGKHLEIRWYQEKKIDDYFKFVIEISFLVLGLSKVEVEKNGVKSSTNKGEVEMRFDAYLLKDYDDKWNNSMMKFFRDLYDKFIIKKRIETFEGLLHTELYKLIDEVKAYLDMHRF